MTTTMDSTERLCNCSEGETLKTCRCGTAIVKGIPSELTAKNPDSLLNKCCNCDRKPTTKIEITAKSSHTKILRAPKPQKVECGNKNVTSIYFPTGPIDFLKACFGPDDYPGPKDMKKYEKRLSHSSDLSAIDEDELRSVVLSETKDLNCPRNCRRVLCDVKLKIKPGSKIETSSSLNWNKRTLGGTKTSTTIKVDANTITASSSAKANKADKETTLVIDKDRGICQDCKSCCLGTNTSQIMSLDAGQTTEIKIKPESTTPAKWDCNCANCLCKSMPLDPVNPITEDCDDDTCEELKKVKHRREDKLIAVTNFDEIKPAPNEQVKSSEILHFKSEAIQAICTCDAETQGSNDMKYYVSSISKQVVCKARDCDSQGCLRCSTLKSLHSKMSRKSQYPTAASKTDELSDTGSLRTKRSICVGESECNNCQHCDAIWSVLSRVEVVTIATFIVCILFYLCYNKMFNIHTKCRHTFC